jgi:glycine/D-amino acid oxidase-like deaminating enzyme
VGKRVLVVGAGIIGASIAWHLTKAGCAVTIVDAGDGGGLATRNSFAWINASWGNPEFYFHFRRRSMAGWRRLERDVTGVSMNWCGGLIWDLPPDRLAAYAEEHSRWGYGIRRVGPTEALAIEPGLLTPPEQALHVPEEGVVEPMAATLALLAGAMAAGANFLERTPVSSLLTKGGSVAGVVTQAGSVIEGDETVIAAGADTARLLNSAGIPLKLDAPAGLIAHSTATSKRLLNGLVLSPDCHVRQTREGRLIAGADFAGADPGGRRDEMALDLLGHVKAMVRGAEDLELDFITVGHRPTPNDGFPAIGRAGDGGGPYVAVLHSGITLAPLVGELAAREIATGERDPDLIPYDPCRAAVR